MTSVMVASQLYAGYGRIEILHGIDLHVEEGEIVAMLGANGAGKTTTLLALAGVIPSRGTLGILGRSAHGGLHERARSGLGFLPDQRGIIRALTVEQNLRAARVNPDEAYEISPELLSLKNRKAGNLSGGEQQILALTRALVSRPKLLLADEMSFGLGPLVVTRMFELLHMAAGQGTGVLLVEQFAQRALEVAQRAYVMKRGTIAVEGEACDLLVNFDSVEASYFGASSM